MRPNWFLAFPISGAFLGDLPSPPPAVRLFHRDDVHLTLTFLGPVPRPAAERAFAAFEEKFQQTPFAPLQISLGEVVGMGRPSEYTALSALLVQGRETLEEILGSFRAAIAEAAGVRPDRRPPKPHVTLARPKRRATPEERALGLSWASSLELSAETLLERVALYTWNEMRRERWFQTVREVPLIGK